MEAFAMQTSPEKGGNSFLLNLQYNGMNQSILIQQNQDPEQEISQYMNVKDPIVGVVPLNAQGSQDGPLISLEEIGVSTINQAKWYRLETEGTTQNVAWNNKDFVYDPNDPWQNYEYFHQYGKLNIHGEMLKDKSRTEAYRDFIMNNAQDFKDKVVLDVGCGTGILSMFAARAGAAKVYAVDASSLCEWTELVVHQNKLQDKVKVIRGKIEEIELPEKVDIIISEWMGTFLIFESMLDSLLFARDQWLKPGGFMFPNIGTIVLAPLTMDKFFDEKIKYWENVYDFDMSVLMPFAKKCAFEKPIIDQQLVAENLLNPGVEICRYDMNTLKIGEAYEKTIRSFAFKIQKTGNFQGFGAWFDVIFEGSDPSKKVILSTSPNHPSTHWHQCLFLFDDAVELKEGELVQGTIRFQRNPDLLRHLILDFTCHVKGQGLGKSRKFYLWGNE